MSDEQHLAMPQLYGGPAYSRPPRPVQEIVRPFDPDELPLEADRADGQSALVPELAGATWASPSAKPARPAKVKGARRSRAAKPAKLAAAAPVPAARPDEGGPGGLQGRPFSLRSLSRIFGGDRK